MPRIVSRIAWKVGRSSGTSFQHLSIRDRISGGQSFGVTSGLNGGVSQAAMWFTIFIAWKKIYKLYTWVDILIVLIKYLLRGHERFRGLVRSPADNDFL